MEVTKYFNHYCHVVTTIKGKDCVDLSRSVGPMKEGIRV